jgi:hypothetical protein
MLLTRLIFKSQLKPFIRQVLFQGRVKEMVGTGDCQRTTESFVGSQQITRCHKGYEKLERIFPKYRMSSSLPRSL